MKSYFHDRSWGLDVTHPNYVFAKSIYKGKPKKTPNSLSMELRCGTKKVISIKKGILYCGIDSIQVINGKVEIEFVDFVDAKPRGYCTKKRKQTFKIPNC